MIGADGKHILERSVACEIEVISACLHDVPFGHCRVGFESGAMSQHLHFGLQAAGFDIVCMEARQVNAALSAMRNKTDETDARGIAQVPRSSWYGKVFIKSREAHALRALLGSRKAVQKCIDLA
ncbi:MAG: transposase [Paracoccaceae bacterium]